MDKRIADFLCAFAGVPLGDLQRKVNLGEVLDRHGYYTEPDWQTHERQDLIERYGAIVPVWKFAGVLLNAGGTFTEGALDIPAYHLLAEAGHEYACGRLSDPFLCAAFAEMNPHMAAYRREKDGGRLDA